MVLSQNRHGQVFFDSKKPKFWALGTQKTLRRTKNLISGYNLNLHPGVICDEIVTLD